MATDFTIKSNETLSNRWGHLQKVSYEYTAPDNKRHESDGELYDTGNAATVLLYNPTRKTVVLTRQFRLPAAMNGDNDGLLLEACAGKIENGTPEETVKREAEEETGYAISGVRKVMEAFMSPGALAERLHFFVGTYDAESRTGEGGGLQSENEFIEVCEMQFDEAFAMIGKEIVDAKTIMLLQYAKIERLVG